MGVTTSLRRLARGSPARCFTAAGPEGVQVARWLRLAPEIVLSDGPRAADVLLCLALSEPSLISAVAAAHDAMPHPRAVVAWWPHGMEPPHWPFADGVVVTDVAEVAATVRRVRDELLDGVRGTSPDVLPDADPAPWRGVGPFGQGGAGMTGGVPYGRPLAQRADDRDGLKLDQLLVRVGPFLPPLPPGLMLDVRIQGDVIQSVSLPEGVDAGEPPSGAEYAAAPAACVDEVFVAALARPVPIVDLEVARARSHLAWLAEALRTAGLSALGRRVLRLAGEVAPRDEEAVARLARRLHRSASIGWSTRGVGHVSAARASALPGGPVARASGDARDARTADPAYLELGFTPVVVVEGDALARWRLRLAEARQSLALAARAGGAVTTVTSSAEGPQGSLGPAGSPVDALVELLLDLLPGMEWGDAVTTIVSLDIPAVSVAAAALKTGEEA